MAIQHKLATHQRRLVLLLVIGIAWLPLQTAMAQSSYPPGLIPAGETVQGSQFLFAPRVNIEGTVDGDVFVIGQEVIVTGEIKGSLFLLSTTATIDGNLEGDLFAANTRLTVESEAVVGRSAYILAALVNMLPGSQVGHDLYLIALGGQLSGTVGRYQRAHIGFLEILVMLMGENGLLRPLLPPGFELPLSSIERLAGQPADLFTWPAFTPGAGAPAQGLSLLLLPQLQTPQLDSAALTAWLTAVLRSFAPLFLIGLLLLWLFPHFLQGSAASLQSRPWASLGLGLVVFFVGFGAATLALALFTALGMFFATIQYWDLALITWAAGLGGLSAGLALFSLAIIYLSKIIVAFLFGSLLLKRMPETTWGRRIWPLLLGVAIVVLLLSIPVLGWVLSVLGTMFGLGAIYLQLARRRSLAAKAPADELPELEDKEPAALEAPAEVISAFDATGAAETEVAPLPASPEIAADLPAEAESEPGA